LTFKASDKDSKYGFSLTYADINVLNVAPRDWNFWWKGQYAKVILGNLRNGDFRTTLPYSAGATIFGGTDRITAYGVLIENAAPISGLTFGVNLPIGIAASKTLDVLQKADVGLKYKMEGIGTATVLLNADFVTPSTVLNAGFTYTGIKDLTGVAIFQGKFNANTYKAALGLAYSGIDKLALNLEGAYTTTAGASAFSVWGQGAYNLTDKVSATVGGSVANGGAYDAYANLGYDFGNGLSSEVGGGYNGALYAAAKIYYSVSF
ncbi:MAG TPA: hypothetical protein PK475_09560, partial [Rectinema sp.]|nr:hypothetical protein [Rectinema sp.]